MIFKNSTTYDTLKRMAMIAIPALAALYATLGDIWGLPYTTQIPASIMAFDTFLGVLLDYSRAKYNKQTVAGDVNLEAKEGE